MHALESEYCEGDVMRVLFSTQYGLGHLYVLAPIAEAMANVGHEIIFACREAFRHEVDSRGFVTHSLGDKDGKLDRETMRLFRKTLNLDSFTEKSRFIRTFIHAGATAEATLYDMDELVKTWKPDLIVRDTLEFSSWAVAECSGIPHASVEIGAFWSAASWKNAAEVQLISLFEKLGNPSAADISSLYKYLHLSFLPCSFRDPYEDYPSVTHSLRPIFDSRSGPEEIPEWISNLDSNPTIYATLGTSGFNTTPGVFESIIEAFETESVNLILTVGRNQDPKKYGKRLDNVKIEQFIPQSVLLPRCDLMITHGGQSTVLGALNEGLPMVVVPLGADQFRHANRCQELDVAKTVDLAEIAPESIRTLAFEVLDNSLYKKSAERIKSEIQRLPGIERAVMLLETLQKERTPILSNMD